jgi:hypothetical protein
VCTLHGSTASRALKNRSAAINHASIGTLAAADYYLRQRVPPAVRH